VESPRNQLPFLLSFPFLASFQLFILGLHHVASLCIALHRFTSRYIALLVFISHNIAQHRVLSRFIKLCRVKRMQRECKAKEAKQRKRKRAQTKHKRIANTAET
jgi:hypothetical protein